MPCTHPFLMAPSHERKHVHRFFTLLSLPLLQYGIKTLADLAYLDDSAEDALFASLGLEKMVHRRKLQNLIIKARGSLC